jgi:hypothetical protein
MAMMPGARPAPKPLPTQAQVEPIATQEEQPALANGKLTHKTMERPPAMKNRRLPTRGAQGNTTTISPESKTEAVALTKLPSPPPSPKEAREVKQMVQPNAMGHVEIVDADSKALDLSDSTVIANDGFVSIDVVQDDFSQAIEEEQAAVKKEIESIKQETQEIINGLGIDATLNEDGFTLVENTENMPPLEPLTPTSSVELESIPLLSAVDNASLPEAPITPPTDNQPAPSAPKGFWTHVGDFFAAIGRFFLMCITCGAYGKSDRQ